jgi:ribosomal protein S18 acetylase RimI-like enzyme
VSVSLPHAESFVREGRRADAGDLARIQAARWRTGYAGLVPDEVVAELTSADALDRWETHWGESLAGPPSSRHRVMVAVADAADGGRRVVGFAAFGPSTDEDRWAGTDAELYELAVADGQTGQGHGSRLINAAAGMLAEDGFTTVSAWVLEEDAVARRFLETSGWAADGARRTLDMGTKVAMIRLHAGLSPTLSDG